MSDEIEEQFDLYKQRSLSRAFKINQLNKKINAKTDLIIRLKQKIKQTQDRLKDAESALSKYADVNNWSYQQIIDDISEVNGSLEGGAEAREYFKKYGESDEGDIQ